MLFFQYGEEMVKKFLYKIKNFELCVTNSTKGYINDDQYDQCYFLHIIHF
jgi:hypothetical protein